MIFLSDLANLVRETLLVQKAHRNSKRLGFRKKVLLNQRALFSLGRITSWVETHWQMANNYTSSVLESKCWPRQMKWKLCAWDRKSWCDLCTCHGLTCAVHPYFRIKLNESFPASTTVDVKLCLTLVGWRWWQSESLDKCYQNKEWNGRASPLPRTIERLEKEEQSRGLVTRQESSWTWSHSWSHQSAVVRLCQGRSWYPMHLERSCRSLLQMRQVWFLLTSPFLKTKET